MADCFLMIIFHCRLVTKGTVDENVYEIAKRKLGLDAAVLESMEEIKEGDMPEKTMGEILSAILLNYWLSQWKCFGLYIILYLLPFLPRFALLSLVPILMIHLDKLATLEIGTKDSFAALEICKIAKLMYTSLYSCIDDMNNLYR